MILVVDNYDSFTYNLVQRLGEIDASLDIEVHRNDQITTDEIAARKPSHLIVSPGPCTPSEAGISVDCTRTFCGKLPVLGVCLGHQSMAQAFGATIVRAEQLMHGKTDEIHHQPDTMPAEFDVSAWAIGPDGEKEIMGIRHKSEPLFGLQFHPESFLSEDGPELLKRFIAL